MHKYLGQLTNPDQLLPELSVPVLFLLLCLHTSIIDEWNTIVIQQCYVMAVAFHWFCRVESCRDESYVCWTVADHINWWVNAF